MLKKYLSIFFVYFLLYYGEAKKRVLVFVVFVRSTVTPELHKPEIHSDLKK